MARLGLLGFSRLACAGALGALLAVACGGESSSDDPGPSAGKGGATGSGGSAGSSGGAKGGKAGSTSGGSSSGTAGSVSSSGGTSGTGASENGGEGGSSDGGTGGKGTAGSAGTGGAPPDIPINQMCETFEPCGGDPEGSWSVVDTCLETPGEIPGLDQPGCEDAVQGVGVDVVGTRTYENGEVTFEQTATIRVAVIVSDECATTLTMSDNPIDANELCPFLPALVGLNMESPFEQVLCEVRDEQCNCDLYMNAETTSTTTTYVVDGTHITQGDGAEYDFCQEGDSLITNGMAESEMSQAVNELTVEFERQ